MAQATTELLQENRGALGWSQKEHCVHLGNIKALVEQIHSKKCFDTPLPECTQRFVPLFCLGACRNCSGRDAMLTKLASHELGMCNAYAEAQGTHLLHIRDALVHLFEHLLGAQFVACVHLAQFAKIVPASFPGYMRHVHIVMHTEVLEGAQQTSIERFP